MEPLLTEDQQSIKSWIKRIVNSSTMKNKKTITTINNNKPSSQDVFGVPLSISLQIANTQIAYEDKDTIIGSIPIVVAKCGSFLKDQGLYVEGVFRKSGSAKRLGELQHQFNSSSDHGIGLSWRGYTVHDAANCLRRFLNYLPEPVIIFSLYESFRDIAATSSSTEQTDNNTKKTILEYQQLIDQLPIINQYLLFYLLDLLALFNRYSQYTKMNSFAIASVFTPGILLNPDHALNPEHYKLSQKVVQFLIEHQDHFHLPRHQQSSQHVIQQPSLSNKNKNRISPTNTTTAIKNHSSTYRRQQWLLLRANTVPTKQDRFGPNDLLQIVNR